MTLNMTVPLQQHPLWCFLLWYNILTLFYICCDILPTWLDNNMNLFAHKGHPVLCKVLSFVSNIANFAPNLLVTVLLLEQTVARWYSKPRMLTRFSAKGTLIAVLLALFVVNVHTLWLYETWQKANNTKVMCDISHIHDEFFTKVSHSRLAAGAPSPLV